MTEDNPKKPSNTVIGAKPASRPKLGGHVLVGVGAAALMAAHIQQGLGANAFKLARRREQQRAEQFRRLQSERKEVVRILRTLDPQEIRDYFTRNNHELLVGHNNQDEVLMIVHTMRLEMIEFGPAEKLLSAQWLVGNGYELKPPLRLEAGVLLGAKYEQVTHHTPEKKGSNDGK